MTDDNNKIKSIIPIGAKGIVRVDNSINITNKLLGILTTSEFEDKYGAVQINENKYTSLNFAESKFRNGDPIKEARTEDEWKYCSQNLIPAYCSYLNNPENDLIFGKLYNYFCIIDKRGLAPQGWDFIDDFPRSKETNELMSINYWKIMHYNNELDLVEYSKNNNDSLFNALPSGIREENGDFYGIYENFMCWTNHSEYDHSDLQQLKQTDRIDILRINKWVVSNGINLGMGWLGSKRHSVINCGSGLSIRFIKFNGSSI